MFGAEEIFRYDPSRSNDKVLNQLQRYRDDELENLRRTGDMQIQAKRETLQNFAKIPESIADSYLQGTEENRRQRQQRMLEEQDARQKELHPLDIESRKLSTERNKFGLAEEQRSSEDTQRQRSWKQAKRPAGVPGAGMTNEEYAYKLAEDAQVAGIQGQKTQTALGGAQIAQAQEGTKTLQQENAIKLATAEYQAALMSQDPEAVKALDTKYKNLQPGLIQLAKFNAQGAIKGGQKLEDITWNDSPQGQKTMGELTTLQKKASTISQVKTYVAQYNAAPLQSHKQNEAKQNIIALLSRPEMGPEGENAADLVRDGVLGYKLDFSGYSNPKGRLDNSLAGIEASIEADLKQIQTQNQGVKAPSYLQGFQNTVSSFQQARNTSTRPPAHNLFMNLTPTDPGVPILQQVNSQPGYFGANPSFPNKQQLNNAASPAPMGNDRFMKIQDRSGK